MKQLNINPEMDKLARDNGLGHWSCTDPINAISWLRSDGAVICNNNYRPLCDDDKKYYVAAFEFMAGFDKFKPIGKDWQQPYCLTVDSDLTDKQKDDLIAMLKRGNPLATLRDFVSMPLNKPTLVQKPFQYPCDGALYFTKADKVQVFIDGFVVTEKENYGELGGVIYSQNKKYWHGKVGNYDFYFNQMGNEINGVTDLDLIMFVLE